MRPLTPIAYCFAAALGVGGLILLFGGLSVTNPIFVGLVVLGLIPAPILLRWAIQLELQYEWLIKGHAKERATEIVTPPKQFRPFIKKLEDDVAHAAELLFTYERSWQRRSFAGQWYGLFVAVIASVCAITALFFSRYTPEFIAPSLPNSSAEVVLILLLALGFAVAAYISCAILIKAATLNAEKLARYLEQRTDQKVHVRPLHPAAVLPALGVFAAFVLIPVAFLQSNFEAQTSVQQQAIAETQEAAKTLEQRLDETLEKKDFFATENAELLTKNQSLTTELTKKKEIEKLLRIEVDSLKDKLQALTATQEKTQATLKTTEETLRQKTTDLKAEVAANKKLEAANTKLADSVAALEAARDELQNSIAAARTTAESLKQAHEAELKKLKTQLAEAQNTLKQAQQEARPIVLNDVEWPAGGSTPSATRLKVPMTAFFEALTANKKPETSINIKLISEELNKKIKSSGSHALYLFVYADEAIPVSHDTPLELSIAQAQQLKDALAIEVTNAAEVVAIPMGYKEGVEAGVELRILPR